MLQICYSEEGKKMNKLFTLVTYKVAFSFGKEGENNAIKKILQ